MSEGSSSRPGRIDRLLKLMVLLFGTGGTLREFALRLGVSERTAKRDITSLRRAGLVLEKDQGHRYALRSGISRDQIAGLGASESERLGLLILRRLAETRLDQPYVREGLAAVDRLLIKLRDDCGDEADRRADEVDQYARYVSCSRADTTLHAENQTIFDSLLQAIVRSLRCRIEYQGAGDVGPTEISYAPYHLYFWNRAWYVIGRSATHDDELRMLKLQRITVLNVTDDRFERPRDFEPGEYLRDAWGVIPSGERERVRIRFSATVARNVAEIRWHESQQHRMLPDGRLEVEFVVSGVHEISWWVMGYGDQAEVLAPRSLREIVAARAAAMVAMYGESGVEPLQPAALSADVNAPSEHSIPMVHVNRVERTQAHQSSESD